ncbi:MAG: class I SAM-dependent methyltransferase, partial [Moorea sp. SIO2I5]|nr:class I SAM-dependent methyltransferase [Moorena sp. SIO2I5]
TSQDFGEYDPSVQIGLQKKSFSYGKTDIVSNITNIPREDCSFDVVLCSEVLEHVLEPQAALRELARLIVPSGLLILTAPFCSLTHFAPFHFSTGFSKFFYQENISQLGCEIIEIYPNENYFDYLAQELRRLPGIRQKYTDYKSNFWMRFAQKLLLRELAKYSSSDKQSSELLCYGFHVLAQKR